MTIPGELILKRGPHTVDHLALGVADTRAGAALAQDRTGVAPVLVEAEPGAWYQSAALRLSDGIVVEIIGPNPAYPRFHPFAELLRTLSQPTPVFWYVATTNFDALLGEAGKLGAPMERVESVNAEDDPHHARYRRGVLGPGFLSQRPCVIQWQRRMERSQQPPRCSLEAFALRQPRAQALNRIFEGLVIVEHASAGPPGMTVVLDTPAGLVEFAGSGLELRGPRALLLLAELWLRQCRRR